MTDIVEQLQMLESGARWVCSDTAATLEDAADEIERLRAEIKRHREALEKIAGITMSMCLSVGDLAQRQKDIALEALGRRHD